jgi:hypothetical protein
MIPPGLLWYKYTICNNIRDPEGRPCTVRYDQVNAMLLNEFLKEHRKIENQQATQSLN